MGILKAFAAFTGWLTGALAGVGVIFYAIGYLITRAHLTFLGIYGLFDESYVQLITKGAVFSLSIASFIGAVLLPLSAVFGVAALLVGLAISVLSHFALSDFIRNWTLPVVQWTQKPSFNMVLYVALLLLLLLHYDRYFGAFQNPLRITNVLYAGNDGHDASRIQGTTPKTGSSGSPAATKLHDSDAVEIERIRQWLEQGDTTRAHGHFRNLLWGEVFAGLLLAAAWHVTIRWRWRSLWLSYFAISFAVYTVALPMIYGVLVDPIEYPAIMLNLTEPALTRPSGKLFLLNKTDQDFVLWDAVGKRILWIPRTEVKWATVGQIENLFGPKDALSQSE